MSATVTPSPAVAEGHITVRKVGDRWGVVLVTPAGRRHQLRTALALNPDRTGAIAYARVVADQMQRPLKIREHKE